MTNTHRPSFAALVVTARQLANQTAAEFDYSLTIPDRFGAFGPYGWLALAAAVLGTDLSAYSEGVHAMAAAAKAKSYTGWSTASRSPIRYADR